MTEQDKSATEPQNSAIKAVSEGEKEFEAIAIVGGKDGEELEICAPCGVCRQVMMEFCDAGTFEIILGRTENEYQKYTLKEKIIHNNNQLRSKSQRSLRGAYWRGARVGV